MKVTSSVPISLLCWSARLAAGQIYVHDDPRTEPTEGFLSALSPVQARMVLAQRAGVEDYHSPDLTEEGVVDALNEFGRRTSLYDDTPRSWMAHIIVEGVVNAEATLPDIFQQYRRVDVKPEETLEAVQPLWLDLARQALPHEYAHASDEELNEDLAKTDGPNLQRENVFFIANDTKQLRRVHDLLASKERYSTTIVVAPSRRDSQKSSVPAWGTYEMPGAQSPLRKRSADRPQAEEPLEVEATSKFQPVKSSSMPVSSLAESVALPGIFPQCFSTQSACESQTRNCTGHGKCYKKYTDNTASDKSPFKDCYTCQCSATKQTTSDGKTKTTYWGGSGCQKKDISTQFWLIALFAVGLVSLVGFAVGQVWEMGNEELPSVIGAGVSGPVKR